MDWRRINVELNDEGSRKATVSSNRLFTELSSRNIPRKPVAPAQGKPSESPSSSSPSPQPPDERDQRSRCPKDPEDDGDDKRLANGCVEGREGRTGPVDAPVGLGTSILEIDGLVPGTDDGAVTTLSGNNRQGEAQTIEVRAAGRRRTSEAPNKEIDVRQRETWEDGAARKDVGDQPCLLKIVLRGIPLTSFRH